jgi:hypothetical protein
MSLADWFLPSEGRLSPDDLRTLSQAATLLPATWQVGLLAPARSERGALPRFAAVSVDASGLALRPARRFDALAAARLPGYGSEGERAFRTAARACRLLLVLDGAETSAARV